MWCSDMSLASASVTADQVQQGEEEDPDDVDEVPVQPEVLDRVVIGGAELPRDGALEDPDQQAGADDHVERVPPGHREVEREEGFRAPTDFAREVERRT